MKIHIFLQARLGSARLPGKVLFKICGKSILEPVVERLRGLPHADDIILVTGEEEKNLPVIEEAKRLGIPYFCGSEENLLSRFYQAALRFKPDGILRVTGDCPLIDRDVLSGALGVFSTGKYDVVSNLRKRTYPDGVTFEIFKRSALEKSWKDQKGESVFVTKYLLESKQFSHFDVVQDVDTSRIRLTIDYQEDAVLIERIYKALYKNGKYFGLGVILDFLDRNPGLLDVNKEYIKVDYGIRP
ncbi:MAG: NTP transferase domain-containing protein [Candidatus Wildermuthbacteria bacterium]|nr:NTP transferase domain-containing protein [Candidatus Wildermuthbacteria bacterium]